MGILVSTLYRARHLRPILSFRGLRIPVTGPHVSRPVWKHIWKGSYERPEIEALLALTDEDDRVLECGTGMGIVSGVLAKAKPSVAITAFEANPQLIEVIHEIHALNGITSIDVQNAILLPNPKETSIQFNLHENFTESSIIDQIESDQSVSVDVEDINLVIRDLQPTVFVCDIEGAEEAVFEGIDLSGLRLVVLELHPHLMPRSAIKTIYDACAAADLYPVIEHSDLQVVAFERVKPAP